MKTKVSVHTWLGIKDTVVCCVNIHALCLSGNVVWSIVLTRHDLGHGTHFLAVWKNTQAGILHKFAMQMDLQHFSIFISISPPLNHILRCSFHKFNDLFRYFTRRKTDTKNYYLDIELWNRHLIYSFLISIFFSLNLLEPKDFKTI